LRYEEGEHVSSKGDIPVYFGRIDAKWNPGVRKHLWDSRLFAAMYDNEGKIDRESIDKARKDKNYAIAGYTSKHAVDTIARMRTAVDEKALVFVDFRGLDGDKSVLVGRASDLLIEEVGEEYTKDEDAGVRRVSRQLWCQALLGSARRERVSGAFGR
jgi:hypothetical protein